MGLQTFEHFCRLQTLTSVSQLVSIISSLILNEMPQHKSRLGREKKSFSITGKMYKVNITNTSSIGKHNKKTIPRLTYQMHQHQKDAQ
jgi:hypothetical protein